MASIVSVLGSQEERKGKPPDRGPATALIPKRRRIRPRGSLPQPPTRGSVKGQRCQRFETRFTRCARPKTPCPASTGFSVSHGRGLEAATHRRVQKLGLVGDWWRLEARQPPSPAHQSRRLNQRNDWGKDENGSSLLATAGKVGRPADHI